MLRRDVFAFLRENIKKHKNACDKKIQHLLYENLHKQEEIIAAELTLLLQSATLPFPRFTYGNHAATLVQYLTVGVLTAASTAYRTDHRDIYTMEKQGL
ncbi:hypothetical protein ACI48D_00845 [Massilia sp. LXY-6]|uniref:hypothetical protein n=1 Tax=Massilia sp. LXY-6 TaxID=3379823 RepID=UPI003EE3137A